MANTIQLTSTQLKSKKDQLKALNTKYKNQLTDMRNTEKAVLKMWDGDASNAFDKKFDKDYAKMEKLLKDAERENEKRFSLYQKLTNLFENL